MRTSLTEHDIRSVVEAFYSEVRQDATLAPIFATKIEPDDWDRHMAHITDFWSSIFLKTGRFNGNPMAKHAGIEGLTPHHFEHWLTLFQQTAEKTLGPEKAAPFDVMARRIGESLQMGLAFKFEKAGVNDHPFQTYSISHRNRA